MQTLNQSFSWLSKIVSFFKFVTLGACVVLELSLVLSIFTVECADYNYDCYERDHAWVWMPFVALLLLPLFLISATLLYMGLQKTGRAHRWLKVLMLLTCAFVILSVLHFFN